VKEDIEELAEKENLSFGSGSDGFMYCKDVGSEIHNVFLENMPMPGMSDKEILSLLILKY